MKRIIPPVMLTSILAFMILIPLSTSGCNEHAIDKNKYSTVTTKMQNLPDVVEIFTLSCRHCRNMEILVDQLDTMIDSPIYKMHAVFNESTFKEAYLYYTATTQLTAKKQGLHECTAQLYELVQQQFPSLPTSGQTPLVTEFFSKHNITKPVDLSKKQHLTMVAMAKKSQDLVDELKLASVPAILIKGRYLVRLNRHKDLNDLAKTVNYLLTVS